MSTLNEKIKKLNDSIYLTQEEREQMDSNISNFMDNYPLVKPNMIKPEKQTTYFSFSAIWGKKLAFAVITVAVIFGASGGAVFASNNALPGDLLYPVKINVAEEIKSAMIFSTKEKANWEAERLQLRLKEMQEVVAKTGSLSSELVKDTENRVLVHTEKVSEAAKNLEKLGDTQSIYEILDRIQISLAEYNSMLQGLMEQNLPINENDIQQVIAQVATTEQNVRLVQQKNVEQLNQVFEDDFRYVNDEPQYGNINFTAPNKSSRLKIGERFDIHWNTSNLPKGTPGYISLWYPSGKKALDLFASPDINSNFNDLNQITWFVNEVGIKPGTWRLRLDLNKDGSGQYWLSDIFVIESNDNNYSDLPNEYGCHPTMKCDAGQVCREGVCVDDNKTINEKFVGYGNIKKYNETELTNMSTILYYVVSPYTPKMSLAVCHDAPVYLEDYMAATEKSEIMARIYGTKSDNYVCVNKIAVVPELETTPEKYTGVVKEFADGGYGSYSYYIETGDGSKIGITTCDKRVFKVEYLVGVAIKTGIPVDIIGYKNNATDKDICLQGLMTR